MLSLKVIYGLVSEFINYEAAFIVLYDCFHRPLFQRSHLLVKDATFAAYGATHAVVQAKLSTSIVIISFV